MADTIRPQRTRADALGAGATARPSDEKLPTLVTELWTLVVRYAKQETVDPVKLLGRYLVAGLAGSLLLATGLVLLAIGALRALQVELAPRLSGNWSWAPYLIVVAAAAILTALLVRAIFVEQRRIDRDRRSLHPRRP